MTTRTLRLLLGWAIAFAMLPVGAAQAIPGLPPTTPLTGVNIRLANAFPSLGRFSQPLYVTGARDGTSRVWVVEKLGKIKIVSSGRVATWLDVSRALPRNIPVSDERGLLSIAFPPGFRQTGRFYICFTSRMPSRPDGTPGAPTVVVQRWRADKPLSMQPKMTLMGNVIVIPKKQVQHNGGTLQFGPEGYLYISVGDGNRGGGDAMNWAQNTSVKLGKILRVDVGESIYTRTKPLPATYRIPTSNPFRGVSGKAPEIWAYGMRNPWRFSFDRVTGDLWLGDVGEDSVEEVDFGAWPNPLRGANLGWKVWEGTHPFPPGAVEPTTTGYTFPIWQYGHVDASPTPDPEGGEAIVGGYVYRGSQYPTLAGTYLCADYQLGRIWGIQRSVSGGVVSLKQAKLLETGKVLSSFGQSSSGQLYVTSLLEGIVYRVEAY